jgi:hypothetical protein
VPDRIWRLQRQEQGPRQVPPPPKLQIKFEVDDCLTHRACSEKKIKEFLPPQFHKLKGFDKDIMREYQQKLTGMVEVNAKYRYVQLCRSLKTYGITCFLVKEKDKKKKNKVIPVLLGITRHAILRMDPETKEVRTHGPAMQACARPRRMTCPIQHDLSITVQTLCPICTHR